MKNLSLRIVGVFATAVIVLIGCNNIFNPSGKGDVSDSTTDGKVSYINSLIQNFEYDEALVEIDKLLKSDSTSSEGYYLKAKVIVRDNNINIGIFAEIGQVLLPVDSTEDTTATSDDPLAQAEGFVQSGNAIIDLANKLSEFTKDEPAGGKLSLMSVMDSLDLIINLQWMPRDSLTRLWYQYKDTTFTTATDLIGDSGDNVLDSALYKFHINYASVPIEYAKFPLSDLKENANQLKISRLVADKLLGVNVILDAIPDISDIENLIEGVSAGELDVSIIGNMDSAGTDSAYRDELNAKLENMGDAIGSMDVGSFLGDFAGAEDTTGGASDSSQTADYTEFSDVLIFYRFQDQKDNDGDGCIDEEIRDNIDNDGDGFIDEDLRLVDTDLFDNDMNGTHETSLPIPDTQEALASDSTYLLFLYDNTQEDSIKVDFWGPHAKSKEWKLKAATDSTLTLRELKDSIGGCWNNYDATQFAATRGGN